MTEMTENAPKSPPKITENLPLNWKKFPNLKIKKKWKKITYKIYLLEYKDMYSQGNLCFG